MHKKNENQTFKSQYLFTKSSTWTLHDIDIIVSDKTCRNSSIMQLLFIEISADWNMFVVA